MSSFFQNDLHRKKSNLRHSTAKINALNDDSYDLKQVGKHSIMMVGIVGLLSYAFLELQLLLSMYHQKNLINSQIFQQYHLEYLKGRLVGMNEGQFDQKKPL